MCVSVCLSVCLCVCLCVSVMVAVAVVRGLCMHISACVRLATSALKRRKKGCVDI